MEVDSLQHILETDCIACFFLQKLKGAGIGEEEGRSRRDDDVNIYVVVAHRFYINSAILRPRADSLATVLECDSA